MVSKNVKLKPNFKILAKFYEKEMSLKTERLDVTCERSIGYTHRLYHKLKMGHWTGDQCSRMTCEFNGFFLLYVVYFMYNVYEQHIYCTDVSTHRKKRVNCCANLSPSRLFGPYTQIVSWYLLLIKKFSENPDFSLFSSVLGFWFFQLVFFAKKTSLANFKQSQHPPSKWRLTTEFLE